MIDIFLILNAQCIMSDIYIYTLFCAINTFLFSLYDSQEKIHGIERLKTLMTV